MNIEYVTDRNSAGARGIEVTDMIDLQQALVADHIADIEREGSAIRAERERDHVRAHAAAGTDVGDHPADLPSRRVRLGRWLVAVGEAISGPTRTATATSPTSPTTTARFSPANDPCDDGNDRLASAA